MTRDNWITIAGIIIAAIIGAINIFVSWKNTSRTIASKDANDQPAQNAGNPTLIIKKLSAKYEPLSARFRRILKIVSRILNFIASYILVQQALKATPITRGDVVIMTVCMGIMIITFLLPIVFNIYDYFE